MAWGLAEAFRNWMVAQEDAVGSINIRPSTIKAYAKLATKAGALSPEDLAMSHIVAGYALRKHGGLTSGVRLGCPVRRQKVRHGQYLAKAGKKLTTQPDTPQGRRDTPLMYLLAARPWAAGGRSH